MNVLFVRLNTPLICWMPPPVFCACEEHSHLGAHAAGRRYMPEIEQCEYLPSKPADGQAQQRSTSRG